MITPRRYSALIDNKILTIEIIADVVHSLNKMAKNSRDKKQEFYDKAKMIRRRYRFADTSRYHESVDSFKELEWECYEKKEYILKTLFKPIALHTFGKDKFLYFKVNGYGFHLPCYNYELRESTIYPNLEVVELEDFQTFGKEIDELLCIHFCNSVVDLIREGDFTFIDSMEISTVS